jgi:hypothetical protein
MGSTRGFRGDRMLPSSLARRVPGARPSDSRSGINPRRRGAIRPSFARRCPSITEGAGNAGCSLHPKPRVRNKMKHTSVVTTGSPSWPGIPRAMVLRLISCSPRRRIRLVTVIRGLRFCPRPVGPTSLREFNTSNGCQNHTALPSASASLVCVPLIAHGKPALRSPLTLNAAASTASRSQRP